MYVPRMTGIGRLRRPLIALTAVGTALLIGACGSSSGSTSTAGAAAATGTVAPYTVTFGSISSSSTSTPITGPWGFAYSKGLLQQWLKPYGITLSLAQFANGPLLTAAMVGGSVDMGVLGDTPALIAESQGLQARFVSQPEVGLVAWVVAQPSIKTLNDLVGKTVAVQQGSYLDRYIQGLLQENGLLGKVKLVAMLSTASTPAFEKGSIDAILAQPTTLPTLQKAGKAYNILAKSETTPSLEGTQAAIISNAELAAHPGLASAWNAVRVKSVEYSEAHASEYYAWTAAQGNSTAALEQESAPLSDYPIPNFTTSGIKQLQGTLNFLISQKEAKAFSIQSWELQSNG